MSDDRRNRPPVPPLLGSMLAPAYTTIVRWRNARLDSGRNVESVPVPVISVGNLSVGGTGKTPFVARVVQELLALGKRPGIAMRGYKAQAGQLSDEQAEYADLLPKVQVVANPKRVLAATQLVTRHNCDTVVLDDGFQHRFLHRDLDLVLIDATRSPFEDHCLPRGWLREPVEALRRAHALIITHAESVEPSRLLTLQTQLQSLHPVPIIHAEHAWTDLRTLDGSSRPIETLHDTQILLASGIGNPTAFQAMANAHGALVQGHIIKPDHYDWTAADLDQMERARASMPVLTTRKDWVKLRRLNHRALDAMLVPQLAIRFTSGEADLLSMLKNTATRS